MCSVGRPCVWLIYLSQTQKLNIFVRKVQQGIVTLSGRTRMIPDRVAILRKARPQRSRATTCLWPRKKADRGWFRGRDSISIEGTCCTQPCWRETHYQNRLPSRGTAAVPDRPTLCSPASNPHGSDQVAANETKMWIPTHHLTFHQNYLEFEQRGQDLLQNRPDVLER